MYEGLPHFQKCFQYQFKGSTDEAIFIFHGFPSQKNRNKDIAFGTFAGFAVGFGWIAMALGMNYLFERKSFGLYAINAGYDSLALTALGFIIGAL